MVLCCAEHRTTQHSQALAAVQGSDSRLRCSLHIMGQEREDSARF